VAISISGRRMVYVKRIVGLPGEMFCFSGGDIYINGEPLAEPYLRRPSKNWTSPPRQLGPQEYYVVGDNRSMPFADHTQGGVERSRIIGKIWLRGNS
jgi:signal peptidase I